MGSVDHSTNIVHSSLGNTMSTSVPYNKVTTPEDTSVDSVAGLTSTMATTQFMDDGSAVKRDEDHNVSIDDLYFRISDTVVTEQSIIDFLRKPIVLRTGVFATTDTYSNLVFDDLPSRAFTVTQGDLWVRKLSGYFGIRMDMRIKLVVNANRFQQGRYIVGWVPFAGAHPTTSNLKAANHNQMHLGSIVQRTTVDHVELDLNKDTTAELLIPFQSVHNFWPLNDMLFGTSTSSLGYLSVYPYAPLVAVSGSTTASYTVYISFENVQLIGAASANSGLPDREVVNKANGVLSGPLRAVSRGFKEFEKIPLLSTYAAPITWVTDRLSRTAALFGFSKPTQGDSLTKFTPLSASTHSQVDGDADARSLGFINRPGVSSIPGLSGTNYDEMDFSYIVRKYAWFNTYTWNTAAAIGNLSAIVVHPYKGLPLGGCTHFQPVAFVAAMFSHWRGSLKFRFKFVKTEFHSGRISIQFYPTAISSQYTAGPQYVHRWVIDIRETNEVEIIVPYISKFPYCTSAVTTGIGTLTIDVVDPLVAPATVSDTVTILAEIAGGDDFEVAMPTKFNYVPQMFTAQSGLDNTNRIMSGTIGGSIVKADPIVASSTCIGDKVSNFRALLKRYTQIRPNNTALASTILMNSPAVAFVADALPIGSNIAVPPLYYYHSDMLTNVAMCYAIWRGGVRLRDVVSRGLLSTAAHTSPLRATLQNSVYQANLSPILINSSATDNFAAYAINYADVIQEIDKNGVISIEVPQYTNSFGRAVIDVWTAQDGVGTNTYQSYAAASGSSSFVAFNIPLGSGGSITPKAGYQLHNIFRSAADDMSLMGFISVPPMRDVTSEVASSRSGFY